MLTIHLPVGVVAAIITTTEYILSTIAALSARATLHGVWLVGLHRGGEAPLNANTRTRRALIKDFVSFFLSIMLVIAAAGVESSLQPNWVQLPYATNSTMCVSVEGTIKPRRLKFHLPPFKVSVEPWVLKIALTLNCPNGIATLGVGSWTHLSGHKMDMKSPICVNTSLHLSSVFVGARLKRYTFQSNMFKPDLGDSPIYTLYPLRVRNLGKSLKHIGTAHEGQGPCGARGISGYFSNMHAEYETIRIHARNMSFAVHQLLCNAHGSKSVIPLQTNQVDTCLRRALHKLNVVCLLESATPQNIYSVELSDMAALYVSEKADQPSYACVTTNVRVQYIFVTPDLATQLIPVEPQEDEDSAQSHHPPTLPVLVPTSVQSISGKCERTIAPIAQSALLFSTEQEWMNLEFASIDRLVRFHAYMMAVSDSLFPLPRLPKPESSLDKRGNCYTRPCYEVTEIPHSWASVLLFVLMALVLLVTILAFLFRLFFRGESWLVGSARWSLNRLLGDTGSDGRQDQETLIEAIQIPPEPGLENSLQRSPLPFRWKSNIGPHVRDWRYDFRFRPRSAPNETVQVNSAESLGGSSSQDGNPPHKQ